MTFVAAAACAVQGAGSSPPCRTCRSVELWWGVCLAFSLAAAVTCAAQEGVGVFEDAAYGSQGAAITFGLFGNVLVEAAGAIAVGINGHVGEP